MIKKYFAVFFLLIFLIGFVNATNTEISVKTIPKAEVQIAVIDGSSNVLERFIENADECGDVSVIFVSNVENFNLILYIKQNNVNLISPQKLMENYPAGTSIYLELAPSWFEFIPTPTNESLNLTNLSLENSTDLNNSEQENNSEQGNISQSSLENATTNSFFPTNLTFFTILGENLWVKRTVYLGGFFLIALIFLFVGLYIGKKRKSTNEFVLSKEQKSKQIQKEIQESEKTIDKIQKRIKELKGQDEIGKIKQNMIEEEEKIIELRRKKENSK